MTRYALFAAATTFAYLAASISTWLSTSARRVETVVGFLVVGVIVALSWEAGLARSARILGHQPDLAAYASGAIDRTELDDRMEVLADVPLNRTVDALAGDGSVLVNDHFFLFLEPRVVNVHPLHSTVFEFGETDVQAFAREMQSRNVTAAIIRAGIPTEPVVGEFIDRCGDAVGTSGPLTAYSIRPECRGDR